MYQNLGRYKKQAPGWRQPAITTRPDPLRFHPESRTITVRLEKGKVCRPKAIDVWIANSEIRYKTGTVELGGLYEESVKGILFGPEPGVKIAIDREKLEYVRKINPETGE